MEVRRSVPVIDALQTCEHGLKSQVPGEDAIPCASKNQCRMINCRQTYELIMKPNSKQFGLLRKKIILKSLKRCFEKFRPQHEYPAKMQWLRRCTHKVGSLLGSKRPSVRIRSEFPYTPRAIPARAGVQGPGGTQCHALRPRLSPTAGRNNAKSVEHSA